MKFLSPTKHPIPCLGPALFVGLNLALAAPAQAVVLGITDFTMDPNPSGNINNTTNVTSFTTSSGTTSTLAGIVSTSGITTKNVPLTNGPINNYWGENASQINGGASLHGLDVGHGITGFISGDVQFGMVITAKSGDGNDFFILGISRADQKLTLQPLDSDGAVIGDYTLSITGAQWSSTGKSQDVDYQRNAHDVGNTTTGLDGVAFDISDFSGTTGDLGTWTGLRITDPDQQLGIPLVAYNTIPEPGTCALLLGGLGVFLLGRRSRRRA